MRDHVDHVDNMLKFTETHTIFGGILDCLRHFSSVVSSAFGYSSGLAGLRVNHPFISMAPVDPIDISSTDSGSSDNDSDLREIDNYRDESPVRDTNTSSSISSRILPDWAIPNHSYLTGRQDPSSSSSSKRQNVVPESSSHSRVLPSWSLSNNSNLTGRHDTSISSKRHIVVPDEISSRPHKRLNVAKSDGASSSRIDDSFYPKNGSTNSGRLVTSHKIHSSHQPMPLKSSLLPSLPSSLSNLRSSNPVETVGATNGKNSMTESVVWDGANNQASKGNRLLPPSLMPGKHTSPSPFVGLNDPFHHTGVGEESPAGADERFVFQAAVQDLHQPKIEADLPEGLLSVSLLRHQKIALAWMLSKESSGLCLGGILADDQGLGKTVSMIALMQMQKLREANSKHNETCNDTTEALNLDDDDDDGSSGCVALDVKDSDDFKIIPQASKTVKGFISKRPTAGTLIVCPASVLRQWARELDEKITRKAKLSVLIYHGGNRTKDAAALAKYDAVLTTYAIVTNEVPKQPLAEEDDDERKDGDRCGLSSAFSMEKKRKKSSANKKSKKGKKNIDMSAFDSGGTLARVKWSRVVLDESQTIKNHRTQVARACCSLRAKRRWCLSGTPIQNSVEELFSYFRFLRYAPYDTYKIFGVSLKSPILKDSSKGYKKLQVVLRNIMLRRTKGTLIDGEPVINLPPKKVHLTRVEFTIEERTFYNKLESDSRKQFKAYAAAGTVNQNYANILLMLLRLRQACDHPLLVKGLSSDPVGKVSSQMAQMLPKELLLNLLKKLEISMAICLVCSNAPFLPRLRDCKCSCLIEHGMSLFNLKQQPAIKAGNINTVRNLIRRNIRKPAVMSKNLMEFFKWFNFLQDPPENAVVTMCGHVFCYQCISDHLTGEDNTCPAPECKEQLGADVIFSKSTLRRCISDDADGDTPASNEPGENSIVVQRNYISSKIKSALEILKSHCISKGRSPKSDDLVRYDGDASSAAGRYIEGSDSRGPEKAIVFSQWTSMLDLVEMSLKKSCISYRRLDGTMSIAARDKAVKDFNTNPDHSMQFSKQFSFWIIRKQPLCVNTGVDVMLMSLKAGNLGLNMVAACRVILLDLWWNPTTEDQAVDRAHRIGQTRPVTVSRLTVKDTVEDRILTLQEDKRKMVASAFGEDQSGGHGARVTLEDLRFLFEGR
ncbi:hypothetical protein OROGR_017401 [Orobanche gracilis]